MTSSCGAGRCGGYWMASRAFELSELKLLVDAVQASKVMSATHQQAHSSINWKPSAPTTKAPSCSVRCTWMAAPKATATTLLYSIDALHTPSMRA